LKVCTPPDFDPAAFLFRQRTDSESNSSAISGACKNEQPVPEKFHCNRWQQGAPAKLRLSQTIPGGSPVQLVNTSLIQQFAN
jgi:hypothetical protein